MKITLGDINSLFGSYDNFELIQKYVDTITDDIKTYSDDRDLELLTRLLMLCTQSELIVDAAKMHRNIGMHFFYNNMPHKAIQYLKKAISTIKKSKVKDPNLLVSTTSELGLVYFYNFEYENAKVSYLKAFKMISLFKDLINYDIVHHLYYRLGILYTYLGKYEQAIQTLETAGDYAIKPEDKGDTILNIGVAYKKQGYLDKALKLYTQALRCYSPDQLIKKSGILNNIADLYIRKGEYDKALKVIKLAFRYLEAKDMQRFFVYFATYSDIKIHQGKSREDLDKLLELLSAVKDFFIFKCFVIEGFKVVGSLNPIDTEKISDFLNRINKLIDDISMNDKNYKKELKQCLNELCLTLSVLANNN